MKPTAGVDVELRQDMWNVVAGLQKKGVTVILTTHYIEEAEQLADRVGVINQGEIILVEDKDKLMRDLGKKQLTLHLQSPLSQIPVQLADYHLETSSGRYRAYLHLRYPAQQYRDNSIARRASRC